MLTGLAWFAGCWMGGNDTLAFHEQWMKPSGGVMLGMSRTVSKGRVMEYEFMRIHEERGEIFYTADPSGQAGASFKLVHLEEGLAVFKNPDHDFPQRIIYRMGVDDSLKARIEGKSKGTSKEVEFPMKRMKCE